MERTEHKQKQSHERSDRYILFLAGIHNLIFVDVSFAGMPLRTLLLLLADFVCIAVYLYHGERILPHWKGSSAYEKTMTVLLAVSVAALVISALAGSDFFWIGVDIIALLLIYPCIYGRKRFPQDVFGVYSTCSCVICVLLLCYYLTGGICEPLIALLPGNNAVVPWLVLGITMNIIAYCFQEKGQLWYGGNILLTAFLLAIQKNVPGMVIAGLIPLMLPLFCRPSKLLVGRAAQAGLMYAFLICNMSLITGYTPLADKIVRYDLEVSVYMELLLAAMGVWFFEYWDKYAQNEAENTTIPELREWCRKAVTACLVSGIGIYVAVELFWADDASNWKGPAQVIMAAVRANPGWKSGLFGQMGQFCGILGITAAGVLLYIGIMRIYSTKWWHVKAHKLYRLLTAVCLLQAVFLPQTMMSLPVYIVFFFLFMETKEGKTSEAVLQEMEQPKDSAQKVPDDEAYKKENIIIQKDTTEPEKEECADETNHSDTMLQRGGNVGNRAKRSAKKAGRHRPDRISDHQ